MRFNTTMDKEEIINRISGYCCLGNTNQYTILWQRPMCLTIFLKKNDKQKTTKKYNFN